ncbi:M16 family metallopeptidase [Shewanella marina]|uniref:M16 family metallopeptidase n=1 Tax=Shewanella marina TaxID=487319 RepID=UPI00047211F3|nr:pitrilysin family protein [Shewanella marina]
MRTHIISCAIAALFCFGIAGCSTMPASSTDATAVKFTMPEFDNYTLDNGLTVYLLPQKEVPLISMAAVVRAGSIDDNPSGIASLTARSLMLGTHRQTKAQIEQIADGLGASITAGADKEDSFVLAQFMSKDSATMVPLFANIVQTPSFNSDELNKLKQRQIAGLSQAKESPRAVINRYFEQFLFAEHPYAKPVSGNRDSLAAITAKQVRQFYDDYYQPQDSAIIVVGDFDVGQMKAQLQQLFGQWREGSQVARSDLDKQLPKLDKPRVLVVNKPDALETTFLIGGIGISRDNPDFIGLEVVNTILGGRFTSWLNDELRVNSGLTYGARSHFNTHAHAGVFTISSFTNKKTTQAAIDLALKTYAKLWQQGVDAKTLASAKAYVKGQFPPNYETNQQLVSLLKDMYIYGLDEEVINSFDEQVDKLTVADTKRLVTQYFPQQNLQFVLIGNAAEIMPIAKQYGEVKVVNINDIGFSAN